MDRAFRHNTSEGGDRKLIGMGERCPECEQHYSSDCPENPRAVTETSLSLPCGCIVTVWPHGRDENPGTEAAVTEACKAHGMDVVAKIRAMRSYALARALDPGTAQIANVLDRVLRLLGAETEGKEGSDSNG